MLFQSWLVEAMSKFKDVVKIRNLEKGTTVVSLLDLEKKIFSLSLA